MSGKVALQLNAVVGVTSTAAACTIMWLLLTRPAYIATTVASGDYHALAAAIGHQITVWLQALLRFM
jgi:hypothetical protein